MKNSSFIAFLCDNFPKSGVVLATLDTLLTVLTTITFFRDLDQITITFSNSDLDQITINFSRNDRDQITITKIVI